jgi:hypothetical protein
MVFLPVPQDGGTEMPLWSRLFRTTERRRLACDNHCGGTWTASLA